MDRQIENYTDMWIYTGYATNIYFLVLFAEWSKKQQGCERQEKTDDCHSPEKLR